MYMHLYAEATLALVEIPHKEIQFKQIVGDFKTLQGKLMLQQEGPEKVWLTQQTAQVQNHQNQSGKLWVVCTEKEYSMLCSSSLSLILASQMSY